METDINKRIENHFDEDFIRDPKGCLIGFLIIIGFTAFFWIVVFKAIVLLWN